MCRYLKLHSMACVKKETEDNYINSIFFRMYIPKVVAVKPFNQILPIYLLLSVVLTIPNLVI